MYRDFCWVIFNVDNFTNLALVGLQQALVCEVGDNCWRQDQWWAERCLFCWWKCLKTLLWATSFELQGLGLSLLYLDSTMFLLNFRGLLYFLPLYRCTHCALSWTGASLGCSKMKNNLPTNQTKKTKRVNAGIPHEYAHRCMGFLQFVV